LLNLKISVDSSRIEAKLSKMTDQIDVFGRVSMPDELMKWQIDDIHRKYPKVHTPDPVTAEMDLETHVQHVVTAQSSRTGRQRVLVRKPVLRPELFTRLCERMDGRMGEELTWR